MRKVIDIFKNHRAIFLLPAVTLLFAVLFSVYITLNTGEKADPELVVVSPHPTAFMIPLIKEFENETGIKTEVISLGTTASLKRITSDENVDVLWGGSILTVGPYEEYFDEYKCENKKFFKDKFSGTDDTITCFTLVPSVIMINNDIIGDIEIKGYKDLLNEKLKGHIAFADPKKSSSSFEHLVNMLYAMGEDDPEAGFEYVEKFIENLDGTLLDSSSAVYEGVANGEYMVGLTFEEAAVTMLKSDKHISIIYMEEGVVSTPDGIYINKASKHKEAAMAFSNFMTGENAQQFIAANLGRRSVRIDVPESGLVIPYEDINSIEVDKDKVISCKDKWIENFSLLFEEVNNE